MPTVDQERGRGHERKSPHEGNGGGGGYYRDVPDRWGRHHTSWLVPLLLVVNVAVFVVAMFVNNCPSHRNSTDAGDSKCVLRFLGRFSFQPLRENPLFGPSSRTLEKLGALNWSRVVHRKQGWRLVTCIWLHAGVVHLLANMLSLVFIGIRLEQQFRFVRIGIIYLLSGLGGSILSSIFIRNRNTQISVGASGALFGLLGAMLSELLTNWTIYSNKAAAFITLITVIFINLAVGILPRVNNLCHIGGFITGFLLGFVLLIRPQFSWMEHRNVHANRGASKYNPCQLVSLLVALGLLIAGFVIGLVMLFRGVNGNDHCHWCHYLSCIPTSSWKCDA